MLWKVSGTYVYHMTKNSIMYKYFLSMNVGDIQVFTIRCSEVDMDIEKHICNFDTLLSPLKDLGTKLKSTNIEFSTQECLDELIKSLKLTWKNIGYKIFFYQNKKLDDFLNITNIIQLLNQKNNKLFESLKQFEQILRKSQLAPTCLSLLIVDYFQNYILNNCTEKDKKNVVTKWFQENKEELKKSNVINTFLLCIHQIEVCLLLLINIYLKEHENDLILKQSRLYAIQRLQWCLHFFSSNKSEHIFSEHVETGSFIQLIDDALCAIVEINVESNEKSMALSKYKSARLFIDQMLCHAMSIAQISLPQDTFTIKTASQKVLKDCDEFYIECSKETANISLCNLFVDVLSNSLCALEQKVNVAVLKLLLKVFRNYDFYLKEFVKFCRNSKKTIQQTDDLDDLIISFDLHVDRIMQIGIFAVACSNHKQRTLELRSCLASLESLECELVPALTALYMEPTIEADKHAEILTEHWYHVTEHLQNLMHLIIDPVAFTQVVLDSSIEIIEIFKNDIRNTSEPTNIEELLAIASEVNLLMKHLNLCLPEINNVIPNDLIMQKHKILIASNECHCAVKKLLVEAKSNIDSMKRVLKRFKILISYLRQFLLNLKIFCEDCDEDEAEKSKSNEISSVDNVEIFDDEINCDFRNNINEELERLESEDSETVRTMAVLTLRGKILLKERSILYQTPMKNKQQPVMNKTTVICQKSLNCNKGQSSKSIFARKFNMESSDSLLDSINISAVMKILSSIDSDCETDKI